LNKDPEHDDLIKSWNFPKLHLHSHLFDDIVAKGTMRSLSTKPFEKLHGPFRKIYQLQTNFKNVEEQVSTIKVCKIVTFIIIQMLRIVHDGDVASYIRGKLNALDNVYSQLEYDEEPTDTEAFRNFHGKFDIGSKLPNITFEELKKQYAGHPSFTRFNLNLAKFLNNFLKVHNLPFPNEQDIQISDKDYVCSPFQSSN
jgi:hypothetical protein